MPIVLNILSEYTYFYMIKKHYFLDFCYLFLKSSKALSVSLILEQCLLHHLMLGKTGIIVVWEISKRKRCKLENFC